MKTIELKKYLHDLKGLTTLLTDTETIVLCIPLYVDGLPSQVIRWMETFEREYASYKSSGHDFPGQRKKIYILANMELYDNGPRDGSPVRFPDPLTPVHFPWPASSHDIPASVLSPG